MHLPWLKKYNLLIFDEIDSTNSEAIRLAKAGVTGNFVIWAQSQTAGRGKYSKKWYSEPGNFYASILLEKNIPIEIQPQLSFVTALAVYDTVIAIAKSANLTLTIGLKWPNDVLVDSKKIAGILLESIKLSNSGYLIIGVGINLRSNPLDIDQPATNLFNFGIDQVGSDQTLHLFISFFEKYFSMWQQQGFMPIRQLWLKKANKLNKVITIDDGKNRISGRFQDIDLTGNIRIKLACGQIYSLSAGEVFFGS
ncbi:Bifunctional ligase/repressor BirA [Candidatus Trichorickettsia mobilis]|uniref:biotin--[biotin carboxyl-carrier protein] ligase n=1 Tax=Candidatus Trichorickettsia mobilis TaxID=1346319 RepID=A0ABZ0UQC2_9RICK|nr:biotin--[acetyl-CoA-carboxylase] ligase [Candidatus Trichorickettsia mobilis]WPY00245.1 Bifunctional ligase/repressor BirA [Candidatus Trichorickettsia mobilis]